MKANDFGIQRAEWYEKFKVWWKANQEAHGPSMFPDDMPAKEWEKQFSAYCDVIAPFPPEPPPKSKAQSFFEDFNAKPS